MKTILWILVATLTLSLISTDVSARPSRRKIGVQETLRIQLNEVLKAAVILHEACFKQDQKRIDISLKELLADLKEAKAKSSLADRHRSHLELILNTTKENLKYYQMERSEKKIRGLKEAFRQLVQISRVFDVDRYKVFFCDKDKGVWLQSRWKANNPFNPDKFPRCGKIVN